MPVSLNVFDFIVSVELLCNNSLGGKGGEGRAGKREGCVSRTLRLPPADFLALAKKEKKNI